MRIKAVLPVVGDAKVVKRFAILPVRIDNETLIWMEPYLNVMDYVKEPDVYGAVYRWVISDRIALGEVKDVTT